MTAAVLQNAQPFPRESQLPSTINTKTATAKPLVQRHDVHTTLNFFQDNEDGSPPAPTYIDKPETYKRPSDTQPVTIHDIAGQEADFTLDKQGFQIAKHVSSEKDFVDDDAIKTQYYDEVEQILKDATGATRIYIFDHTIRREDAASPSSKARRGPVQRVHIDQSYEAALDRVSYHLPTEADALLAGRVQIINVWRPIKTVERDPLAFANATSVPDTDLVPLGLIYPQRKGETYGVRHNEAHRWHYRSRLTPEDVILIKCFDSKTDGRARRVPHSAFEDPDTKEGTPSRESIEVRALVFHPDDMN